MNAPQQLHRLLSQENIIVAPGCYDGLSARIIEHLGFKVAYLTGYGIEASRFGMPDIGFASMAEVIDHASNICDAITLPVICDADTGYGDSLNVWRTVKKFEKTGVAGIHIEDQAIPKKCGGLPGREVIPMTEMVGKIKAAVDAVDNKQFAIIARSDAKATLGIEEAKRRYDQYLNAGALLALIGERYTVDELADMGRTFPKKLVICTGILGWDETTLPVDEYEKMGIKVLIYPTAGLYAAAKGITNVYEILKSNRGLSADDLKKMGISFYEANELLGLSEWNKIREAYIAPFH